MSSFNSIGRSNGVPSSSSSSSLSSSSMKIPLSKEQMRNARLIALGQSELESRPSSSNYNHYQVNKINVQLFQRLQRVIYEGGNATIEDMHRWYSEGFLFCQNDPFYGLKQSNGGPCGLLAVLQAEIIKEMLFHHNSDSIDGGSGNDKMIVKKKYQLPLVDEIDRNKLLAMAIVNILHRAAAAAADQHRSIQLLIPSDHYDALITTASTTNSGSNNANTSSISSIKYKYPLDWTINDLILITFQSKDEALTFILKKQVLSIFQSTYGCIVFLMSLVLTRDIDRVISDMDDINNTCKCYDC